MSATTTPLQVAKDSSSRFPINPAGLSFSSPGVGYVGANLTYYETAAVGALSAPTGLTAGTWTPNPTVTKFGNILVINLDVGPSGATVNNAKIVFAAASIPVRFRPSGNRTCTIAASPTVVGANEMECVLGSDGSLTFQTSTGGTFNPTGGVAAPVSISNGLCMAFMA